MVTNFVRERMNGFRPQLRCEHVVALERLQARHDRLVFWSWALLLVCGVLMGLAYHQGYRDGLRRGQMEWVFPGDRGGEHE